MGQIPQDFIDDVTQRSDILEIIGTRVTLKQKGASHWGLCPFHNEKTPSFKVDAQRQLYYCFGCGASGNGLSFLLEHDRLTFPEAIEWLAERAGLKVPKTAGRATRTHLQPLYALMSEATRYFSAVLQDANQGAVANEYLRGRGLNAEMIEHFRLGVALDGWDHLLKAFSARFPLEQLVATGLVVEKSKEKHFDRFRNRLMFPVRSHVGQVVGFGARILNPKDEPKYLNSPQTELFNKGLHLYGLYEASAKRKQDYLLFVEGYMDVIALTQAGISGAVACMGTTVSAAQLKLALRYTKKLYFCFDGDAAGRKAASRTLERALPVLDDDHLVHFMFLPEGADPDSLVRSEGADAFRAQMEAAQPLSNFFISHLQEGLDLQTLEGRAMLLKRAEAPLREILGQNLKRLLAQSLEKLSGLTYAEAAATSARAAPSPSAQKPAGSGLSLVQKTVSLLLDVPAEAQQLTAADCDWLKTLDDPDAMLLDGLIKRLHDHPTDNSAVLIAQFNGEPDYERIMALYQRSRPLSSGDQPDQAAALRSAWQRLSQQATRQLQKNRLQQLKSQAATGDLSPEEITTHLAHVFPSEQPQQAADKTPDNL